MSTTHQDISSYALLVASALALLCLMFMLFPQSDLIFEFGVLSCALIAGGFLFVLLSNPRSVRFGWFLGASILFFYSVSTAYPVWESKIFGGQAATFQKSYALWSEGIVLLLVACALLLLVGSTFERSKLSGVGGALKKPHRLIIYSAVVSIGFLYATGQLSLNGIAQQEGGQISPIASLALSLCAPTAGWAAYNFFEAEDRGVKVAMLGASLILLLYLIPVGRRPVFFGVITIGFGSFMSRKNALRYISFPKKAVAVVATVALIYVSSFFFFAMRIAGYQLTNEEDTLYRHMEDAYELVVNRTERIEDNFRLNIRRRSSVVIGYLSKICRRSSGENMALGKVAEYALVMATPSVILQSPKKDLLGYGEEDYAVRLFGMRAHDRSNSVITAGVVDFGLIGGVVYAFALLFIYILFWRIMQNLSSSEIKLFMLFSIVNTFLQVEANIYSYFVHLRNLLLIVGIFILFVRLYYFLAEPVSKRKVQLHRA